MELENKSEECVKTIKTEAPVVSTFKIRTVELAEQFEKLAFKKQSELSGKVLRHFKIILANLNNEKWSLLAKSLFSCTGTLIADNLPITEDNQIQEEGDSKTKGEESNKKSKKLSKQSLRLLTRCLLSVFLIKVDEAKATEMIHELLFGEKGGLGDNTELQELNAYILYRYLNLSSCKLNQADMMVKLRDYQTKQAHSLVGIVFNHILRNMLLSNHIEEAGRFLKHCEFPEHEQNIQLSKFLFYKGFYMGLVGNFSQSGLLLGQALQKAPEDHLKKESRALKNFKLVAQKQLIIVSLLMSEMPSPRLFRDHRLKVYKELVLLVSKGHFQKFRVYLESHKELFKKDLVYTLLLKLKSVVLKNGLKKLSQAYSSLSIYELLYKLGLHNESKLQVNAFLAKVMGKMSRFVLTNDNKTVIFKREERNLSDDSIRQALSKRIVHVKSLEEQMVKALKFPDENKDEKGPLDEEDEYDLDDLDFSFEDMF